VTPSDDGHWEFVADLDRRLLAPITRELNQQLRAAIRQRERSDDSNQPNLLAWGRRYLGDHFSKPPSFMHRWLARQLGTREPLAGLKLNVLGPRGAAKSTLVTLAFVLRMAVESRQPYIWLVSDTHSQAETHLANLKTELIDNARLARDYPQAAGRGSIWRRGAIRLRNGVLIEAYGTGQSLRGRRDRTNRPTLIICDDLQNDQHVVSAAQRQKCRAWFHSALMRAGTSQTAVIQLATALHRDALAVELCRTPGWRSRVFQSVIRWPRRMDLWQQWQNIYSNVENRNATDEAREFYRRHREEMDDGAKVLWPAVEDLYALMCLRSESGPAAFAREKQNRPLSPELCEWSEDYFGPNVWFDEWPENLRLKTMALDPSKGADARTGDFSAFVLLGIGADGLLYVQADMARRPTPQIVADGVALYQQFRPDALGVEVNQFQHLLADAFEAEFLRQGIIAPRPYGIDNRVNKLVRIRRLGPYLAAGRLRFKSGCASTQQLVEQLRDFPTGDHDDGPDAAEMALRLATRLINEPDSPDDLGGRLEVG